MLVFNGVSNSSGPICNVFLNIKALNWVIAFFFDDNKIKIFIITVDRWFLAALLKT